MGEKKQKKPNIREERFAQLIAIGETGPNAVIEAGYKATTRESARAMAYKLNQKVHIRDAIERAKLYLLPKTLAVLQLAYDKILEPPEDMTEKEWQNLLKIFLDHSPLDEKLTAQGTTNNNLKIAQVVNRYIGK